MKKLLEVRRNELISKSTSSVKGKERFNKRNKSHIKNTVKAMNSIDMNKLFKDGILTVNLPIHGETDDYTVKITFGGFIDLLRDQIKNKSTFDFRDISRAVINGFNQDDVYIHCSCPDFSYRFSFYATRNDFNSGTPEIRPSDITNPKDTLGSACKHVLLVLNNTSWILRVSRAITNYIRYIENNYNELYKKIIEPALFNKDAIERKNAEQHKLASEEDTDILDVANKYNQERTRFKPGNKQGVRFAPKETPNEEKEENPDDIM